MPLLSWPKVPKLLRVEYAIEKPSTKLLTVAHLDSDTWVAEVKRIRDKKPPLTAPAPPPPLAPLTRQTLWPGRLTMANKMANKT
jgi:hypothetical protein